MKKFSLGCEHDHEFEGWFADADAIRQQLQAGLLTAPIVAAQILKNVCLPQTCPPQRQRHGLPQNRPAPQDASAPCSIQNVGP